MGRIELALFLTAAATVWWLGGVKPAVGLLLGGLVVYINGLLQRWQQNRAARVAGNDPVKNVRYLYRCAAERFVTTVALFAAGLGLMALPPLPMLSGYIAAQVAVIYRFYQVSSSRRRHG